VGGVSGGVPGELDSPHPLVLVSRDGGIWSAVDGAPAFSGAGLVTRQAVSSGGTYVIVGDQSGAVPGHTIAAAWWSDGLDGWQRAGDAVAGSLDDGAASRMLAVTATANGFAAAGSHGARPAVWLSRRGLNWSRIDLPRPAGAAAAVLQHVVANGRTVVATGVASRAGRRVPFVARSADDGMTWREVVLPSPAGVTQVTALTAIGSGFAATGTFGVGPGHQDVVIWTSADGMRWVAATPAGRGFAGPGIKAITGLDASGDMLTGVGFTATPTDEQPTLWLARIHLAAGVSQLDHRSGAVDPPLPASAGSVEGFDG
jgi:hypothetical protein